MTDILQKFREEARLTLTEMEKLVRNSTYYQKGKDNIELRQGVVLCRDAQLNKALSLRLNDNYKPDPKGRYVLGIVDLEGEAPECEYYYTGETMKERCPIL